MINVQNDILTPYSPPQPVLSGYQINYKPANINIIAGTIVGNVYLNGQLSQTFTANQSGECTFNFVSQMNNWIKFAFFDITTGYLRATWADNPDPVYTYSITMSYSYNTAMIDPAFLPTHEDGN